MKFLLFLLAIISYTQCLFKYSVVTKHLNKRIKADYADEFAFELQNYLESAKQTKGYCTKYNPTFPIKHRDLCGHHVKKNAGYIITLEWTDASYSNWDFEIGSNFGYGAAVFVNDLICVSRNEPLEWNFDWNSQSVIQFSYAFEPGTHRVTIYGGESVLAKTDIRYKKDNDKEWKQLNLKQGNCDVPYPKAQTVVETKLLEGYPDGNNEQFALKLQDQFKETELSKGYCDIYNPKWPISNHGNCPHGTLYNIFFLFNIQFDLDKDVWLEFEFGVDFGRGNAVFVNGQYFSASTDDKWWGGNYNYKSEVINVKQKFRKGCNLVQVYGREGCCDGAQSVRFRVEQGHFHSLTQENWNKVIKGDLQVKVHTRKIPGEDIGPNAHKQFPNNFPSLFLRSQQPKGYCRVVDPKFPVENSNTCKGPDHNILWKINIEFYETKPADYIFQLGLDFGVGTLVFVNGKEVVNRKDDLWWAYNWNNKNEVIDVPIWVDAHSYVHIEIYGGEKCCDGRNDIRLRKDGKWYSIGELHYAIDGVKCEQQKYY